MCIVFEYYFELSKDLGVDQALPVRFFKSVFDNVLLKHGKLPHVLHLDVHLSRP